MQTGSGLEARNLLRCQSAANGDRVEKSTTRISLLSAAIHRAAAGADPIAGPLRRIVARLEERRLLRLNIRAAIDGAAAGPDPIADAHRRRRYDADGVFDLCFMIGSLARRDSYCSRTQRDKHERCPKHFFIVPICSGTPSHYERAEAAIKRNIFGALSNKSADDQKLTHQVFCGQGEHSTNNSEFHPGEKSRLQPIARKAAIFSKNEEVKGAQRAAFAGQKYDRKTKRFLLASQKKYI
jgi:hypothetical protein